MNSFTARKIAEGRTLYEAMCKGKVAQRSIRSMHGKRHQTNKGIVIGQNQPYHGHVTFE